MLGMPYMERPQRSGRTSPLARDCQYTVRGSGSSQAATRSGMSPVMLVVEFRSVTASR